MTLAYVESEDRMVDVEAMLREFDTMPPVSLEEGRRVIDAIQQEALLNGTAGMTMEQIDEEIAACRRERRDREARAMMKESSEDPSLALA